MYKIILDNRDGERYILHDSRSNKVRVIGAKCEMELNKTGTLSFKINSTHPHFNDIFKHKSEIYLYQDNECIFCGRVLNDDTDIYNFKTITCEGMLGYLLDSIQRAKSYSITGDTKIKDYLTDILNIHNSQVDDYKKFSVGDISEVDSSETFYKISSYEDTLTTLNKDLIDTFKHTYLSASFKNARKVINYVNSDKLPVNNQIIRFGKNLLSLNRTLKGEEIATAIIPLGATIESEETNNGTVDYKLTIENIKNGYLPAPNNHLYKQDDYIYDVEAVKLYGKIFKVVSFDGIESDTTKLLNSGVEQLNYYSKLASTIELTAFDLHLLDVSVDSFRVGQKVRVYSKFHGLTDLNDYLIVQRLTIDLDRPDNTTIVLGDEKRTSIDVSSSSAKKTNDTNNKIALLEKELSNNNYIDKNYFASTDFDQNMNDYFDNQIGTESYGDLSQYALISDVQYAFDFLANLLRGV